MLEFRFDRVFIDEFNFSVGFDSVQEMIVVARVIDRKNYTIEDFGWKAYGWRKECGTSVGSLSIS